MLSKAVCKRCVVRRRARRDNKDESGYLWTDSDEIDWARGKLFCGCVFTELGYGKYSSMAEAEAMCDKLFEQAVAAGMTNVK